MWGAQYNKGYRTTFSCLFGKQAKTSQDLCCQTREANDRLFKSAAEAQGTSVQRMGMHTQLCNHVESENIRGRFLSEKSTALRSQGITSFFYVNDRDCGEDAFKCFTSVKVTSSSRTLCISLIWSWRPRLMVNGSHRDLLLKIKRFI